MPVLIVAAATLLLAAPYLPILLRGDTVIIGETLPEHSVIDDSDVYDQAWHFWWVSTAIARGDDPRFCTLVYSPDGASMAYQHIGWADTFLFSIRGMGGRHPVLSYNLSLLSGTLLTALFGWFLARSWGISRTGALFAAMAIGWLPVRTAHLVQHYQIANCWAMIASLWLSRSYLASGRSGPFKLAGYSAAVLVASMESPFLALFSVLGLSITLFLSTDLDISLRSISRLLAALVPAFLWSFLFIFTAPGDPGSPVMNWREAIYWAAEPQSFILPSPFGLLALITGMPERFSWMSNVFEGVVTPGFLILVLLCYTVFRARRWRLAAAVILLCILSLGPELRLLGRPLGIPLPFRLLQLLPITESIRSPSRFSLLAGVLAAIGSGWAFDSIGKRWRPALGILLIFELFIPVLPVVPASIPDECLSITASTRVMEVPVDASVRRYSLFQTGGGYTRAYSYMTRPGNLEPPSVPLDGSDPCTDGTVLIYHRWLFIEEERIGLDSILAPLFPDRCGDDSVWVSAPGGEVLR